ncbi:heat shock protein 23 [Teleopsis dalmanni]|uniref:heat shock protein 23 n=1 Tax=Teleopsis dalmanni TaxID=139649 RepID=UPI0018CE5B8C|nr:heat shock protein 23 [Teleopsis dalmanni]
MPIHWDWDWDSHHYWHWPRIWRTDLGYHLKCPSRRRYWGLGAVDFDMCAGDWHVHHTDRPWCHNSCLASSVIIETGDELDTNGKGTFKVVIDVHHFRADELVVKVKNSDNVLLEGKQKDDRADNTPLCITREFTRKYKLPRNYDATQARAILSSDGILTIIVPAPPPLDDVERVVDIEQTGSYFGATAKDTKAIESNDDQNSENKTA